MQKLSEHCKVERVGNAETESVQLLDQNLLFSPSIEPQRERDIGRGTKTESERQRQRQRDTERGRETERERERHRQRNKDRAREAETEAERQRQRQRDRGRDIGRGTKTV